MLYFDSMDGGHDSPYRQADLSDHQNHGPFLADSQARAVYQRDVFVPGLFFLFLFHREDSHGISYKGRQSYPSFCLYADS